MSKVDELKPCPFCGGPGTLHAPRGALGAWISCAGCGLEGPTETGVTEADATEAWNRRATPSAGGDGATDEIVTRLYRRFKDWSKRGFGPEDVTWCEVKADIAEMVRAALALPAAAGGDPASTGAGDD